MENIEEILGNLSNMIWPFYLPVLTAVALYVIYRLFKVKNIISVKKSMNFKQVLAPTAISLGNMVGSAAVVGVLGVVNRLTTANQFYIESMCAWGLLSACIFIPMSYSEILMSKLMKKSAKEYISMLVSPKAAAIYSVLFIILYVFGFGGFQFNGMMTSITAAFHTGTTIELSSLQRYLFIVVPIVLFAAIIVLTKKQQVFVNAMVGLIGTAVAAYTLFFIFFVIKTADYLPEFFARMIHGMANPVAMGIGIPFGAIVSAQRTIQCTDAGMGAYAMASHASDVQPREAAFLSIPAAGCGFLVSIVGTTYIASYGMAQNILTFPQPDSFYRLVGYLNTARSVAGTLGFIIVMVFVILSGISTILGSYYFITKLIKTNNENYHIWIYILLIAISGTLAVFGFSIVFDVVDILLFVVTSLNLSALVIFYKNVLKKNYVPRVKKTTE